MGRGVDKDVLVLPGHPYHFVRPGIANVTRDNPQLGEGKSHLIEIGNRTPRFGRHKGACMTDLGAERNIQLDTCDVEGKIELVVGWLLSEKTRNESVSFTSIVESGDKRNVAG